MTRRGFAFLNVVACRIEKMRPAIVPRFLGATCWQGASRLHVRARQADGGAIEGLYFLRTDVDRRMLARVGNVLTDFRFNQARIRAAKAGDELALKVEGTDGGFGDAAIRAPQGPRRAPPDRARLDARRGALPPFRFLSPGLRGQSPRSKEPPSLASAAP